MAYRNTPLVTDEIYHIFNRSVARHPIFVHNKECYRFLEIINFYRFFKPELRYSHYCRLTSEAKQNILNNLCANHEEGIEIYAFAIMPNHFHIVAKQIKNDGIRFFVSQIQNSYAKYYNTKYKREGALFQEMFKAVRIETDEQYTHLVRYIHLNPLTSYIIKDPDQLNRYPWTSFTDYMGNRDIPFLIKNTLDESLRKPENLRTFTFDQLDYQRTLKYIESIVEKPEVSS